MLYNMAVSKAVIYLHRPVITNTAPKTYHKQLLIIRSIDIKKEYTQDNQQLSNSAIKKVSELQIQYNTMFF
jgi:hypothetical protein